MTPTLDPRFDRIFKMREAEVIAEKRSRDQKRETEATRLLASLSIYPVFFPPDYTLEQKMEYCRMVSYRRRQMRGEIPVLSPFHNHPGRS